MQHDRDDIRQKHPLFHRIGTVAPFLTLVLVLFLLVRLTVIERQLALQHAELEQAHKERSRMQLLNEKIYQTVVSALATRDSIQQEIAQSLVVAMNDDPVRDQLMKVMTESPLTVASVKQHISHVLTIESTFEFEESEVPAITLQKPTEAWKKWNYDIFYLEEHPSDSILSNTILHHLLDNGYTGRIRVRVMPATVNMRSGYHVTAPEVRFNTWEKQGADEVLRLCNSFTGDNQPRFSLHTVAMNTPNYISIFVVR